MNLESIALFIAALQVGILFVATVLIIIRYARHRKMLHITLVATSYIILTALVSGSAIYRMFLDGWLRDVALIMAMIAFALGDISLWHVWQARPSAPDESWSGIHTRIEEHKLRIERLENALEIERTQQPNKENI